MKILGICNDETASACLMIDGVIQSAVSEERFSRVKLDCSFPHKSIDYCLHEASLSLDDVDVIAYAWSKGIQPELLEKYVERAVEYSEQPQAYETFQDRIKWEISNDYKKRSDFDDWVKENIEPHKTRILDYFHHEAHAASAAYYSPFKDGIVFTSDARGDFESSTIWRYNYNRDKKLEKIYSALSTDSFGFYYGRITGLLGYKPMRHEGKITGLAAFGDKTKALDLCEKMLSVSNGEVRANIGDYYRPFFSPYSCSLQREVDFFLKEDVAAAAQYHLERMMTDLLQYYLQQEDSEVLNLMLAGGVFGNPKVTHELKKLAKVANVYVQPQMGDGGLCLGACALANEEIGVDSTDVGERVTKQLKSMYLGPFATLRSVNTNSIEPPVTQANFSLNDAPYEIANSLMKNQVIGLINGRMEFGPRALCNRSIFYRTSDQSINDWLNKRMIRTEFMPFSPVIRKENAADIIKDYDPNDCTLNFMTSTVDCTDTFAEQSPAVVHVDKTARPQIVTEESNNFIWQILREWEKFSGELALVNTSFNVHEEPIICDVDEGLQALTNKVIDELWVVGDKEVSQYLINVV